MENGKQKMKTRLLVSVSMYKELGSHHSVLTTSKMLKTEKSTTLLVSLREGRIQGKPLPPRLERQVNTRTHGLTRAETHK